MMNVDSLLYLGVMSILLLVFIATVVFLLYIFLLLILKIYYKHVFSINNTKYQSTTREEQDTTWIYTSSSSAKKKKKKKKQNGFITNNNTIRSTTSNNSSSTPITTTPFTCQDKKKDQCNTPTIINTCQRKKKEEEERVLTSQEKAQSLLSALGIPYQPREEEEEKQTNGIHTNNTSQEAPSLGVQYNREEYSNFKTNKTQNMKGMQTTGSSSNKTTTMKKKDSSMQFEREKGGGHRSKLYPTIIEGIYKHGVGLVDDDEEGDKVEELDDVYINKHPSPVDQHQRNKKRGMSACSSSSSLVCNKKTKKTMERGMNTSKRPLEEEEEVGTKRRGWTTKKQKNSIYDERDGSVVINPFKFNTKHENTNNSSKNSIPNRRLRSPPLRCVTNTSSSSIKKKGQKRTQSEEELDDVSLLSIQVAKKFRKKEKESSIENDLKIQQMFDEHDKRGRKVHFDQVPPLKSGINNNSSSSSGQGNGGVLITPQSSLSSITTSNSTTLPPTASMPTPAVAVGFTFGKDIKPEPTITPVVAPSLPVPVSAPVGTQQPPLFQFSGTSLNTFSSASSTSNALQSTPLFNTSAGSHVGSTTSSSRRNSSRRRRRK